MGSGIATLQQSISSRVAQAKQQLSGNNQDQSHEEGAESAVQIIHEIKCLEKNIDTWSKKIYDVQDDALKDKFVAERSEFVRRLGVLRHRPRIPDDEQPIISMSPYSRQKGATSETLQLLSRASVAGKCSCEQCVTFVPNTYDVSLCKTCEHSIHMHYFDGPPLQKSDQSYPRRTPTRKELERTAMFTEFPRTDPSCFPQTLIEQAKDAPPRPKGIDDPEEYEPPEVHDEVHDEVHAEEERGEQSTSASAATPESPEEDTDLDAEQPLDKICGTDIEQQLIDAGFSAEAGRGMLTYEDGSHYDGEWAVFEMGGKIERQGYGSHHYASGEIHCETHSCFGSSFPVFFFLWLAVFRWFICVFCCTL